MRWQGAGSNRFGGREGRSKPGARKTKFRSDGVVRCYLLSHLVIQSSFGIRHEGRPPPGSP